MAHKRKIEQQMPDAPAYTDEQLEAAWRRYPDLFFKDCLGITPSNQQDEALRLLGNLCDAKMKRMLDLPMTEEEQKLSKKLGLSIHSGHNTGKTRFLGGINIWWIVCWPYSEGRMLAPTSAQLQDNLWKEMRVILRKAPEGTKKYLNDRIEIQSEKVFRKDAKGEWFIVARTCNAKASPDEQAETLAGAHKDYLLFGVDESSGVPDGVFNPLEGALGGAVNLAILIGNPTRGKGYFADSHGKFREFWIALRWDCEKSNMDEVNAGADLAGYIERSRKKYGEDSNFYRTRVKGLLPLADKNTLIPMDWIEDAINREIKPLANSPEIAGIDVAAGGENKSILTLRKGPVTKKQYEFDENRPEVLCDRLMFYLKEPMPAATGVDGIGWGWGIAGDLRRRGVKNVRMSNSSEKAAKDSRFHNKRMEEYWELRERFERGDISIPDDDELVSQLSALRMKEGGDQKGRLQMESKKEAMMRGVPSPDKADSLRICYAIQDYAYVVKDPIDRAIERQMLMRENGQQTHRGWLRT